MATLVMRAADETPRRAPHRRSALRPERCRVLAVSQPPSTQTCDRGAQWATVPDIGDLGPYPRSSPLRTLLAVLLWYPTFGHPEGSSAHPWFRSRSSHRSSIHGT